MKLHEGNAEEFERLSNYFKDAERRLKLVEIDGMEGIDIPSINELRYVTFHIIEAFKHNNPTIQADELRKAQRHCMRASYDAMELGLLQKLEAIAAFKESNRDIVISSVIPDFSSDMSRVQEISDWIASDSSSGREEKERYYSECEEKYKELHSMTLKYDSMSDELAKARKDKTSSGRVNILLVVLSIVSTSVAVISLIR